jgi:hypothetical protein
MSSDACGRVVTATTDAFSIRVAPDFDGDGDADLDDFGHFLACYNGPNQPAAQPDCADADIDGDTDIDLYDFREFQACFNGPNRPPACL